MSNANDIFMLAADGDAEKAEVLRETNKKDYHRQKTAENREMWSTLGVKQVNVACTADDAVYIKAVASLCTAIRLYELVEARDAATVETLCNVRPKYGVSEGEMRQLRETTENPHTIEACAHILWALSEARAARAAGYGPECNPADAPYYLAREFVLARYAKGSYDMMVYNIQTRSFGGVSLKLEQVQTNAL